MEGWAFGGCRVHDLLMLLVAFVGVIRGVVILRFRVGFYGSLRVGV